eukprot:3936846-Pyramimonas_sp.AAC.1
MEGQGKGRRVPAHGRDGDGDIMSTPLQLCRLPQRPSRLSPPLPPLQLLCFCPCLVASAADPLWNAGCQPASPGA